VGKRTSQKWDLNPAKLQSIIDSMINDTDGRIFLNQGTVLTLPSGSLTN
jgi:hypothetical protein